MKALWFEDYDRDLRLQTVARKVSDADLVNFAAISGTYQSRLIEWSTAQSSDSGRIVPAAHVYALSEKLVADTGVTHEHELAFVAMEAMIRHPVRVGDTIHVEVVFDSKLETPHAECGIVTTEHRVLNQRSEEVLKCRLTRVIRRRSRSDEPRKRHSRPEAFEALGGVETNLRMACSENGDSEASD